MAVGQLPQARDGCVDGMVEFEVLTLQIGAALPAVVEPDEEDPNVVRRAFADQEGMARDAAGLVNQGRGGRPAGIVESGVASSSKVLPHEIARPPREVSSDVDRTLPLDVADHIRHRVLRGNRQHEVNMVDHQVPFFHLALAPLAHRYRASRRRSPSSANTT